MIDPKVFHMPFTKQPFGALGLDFHQVAIHTQDIPAAIGLLSEVGFSDWHHDTAELNGMLVATPITINARMAFNYQLLDGKELEFVHYLDHPAARFETRRPFLSHMSAYVNDIEEVCAKIESQYALHPYHRFETSKHTNPRVAGRKHFREAIFSTRNELGFDLKLIEKVIDT